MCDTKIEMIKALVEFIEGAIIAGEWTGDPNMLLNEAADLLEADGYTRDGITGEHWIR